MKISFSKPNADIFSNYNEPDLRMLFPILEEIKDKQYKTLPKKKLDNLDTLFDIITHVSLLHNQIFHIAYTDITKNQIAYILQLNRFNLEKSITDFFNSKQTIEIGNEIHSQQNNQSNKNTSLENSGKKEKEIIFTKLNKDNHLNIKQYVCVNSTMRCNSQINIKKLNDYSHNTSQHNTITSPSNMTPNKNDKTKQKAFKPMCPLSEKKAQCNHLLESNKKMPNKTIYSKTLGNFNNTKKKYQRKSLDLKIEPPKKKAKLYMNCNSYQSFEKKKDQIEYRDIAKPSNYTKYLLQKYRDVVETYGDELRHSLNTSMKRSKSTNKREKERDSSKSFEHSPEKLPDEKKRMNSSNCFIKINKMPPHN